MHHPADAGVDHKRDWEQYLTKTKWMKIQYKHVHDANKRSGAYRQAMPFYEEVPYFLAKDKIIIKTLHTYSTSRGWQESLVGNPPEEEA